MPPKRRGASRPLRVAHVLASGARGGGASHLCGLLPALRAHDVTPIAMVGEDGPLQWQLTERGIETVTLPASRARRVLRDARRLASIVHQHRIDVVHAHGTRAACVWTLAQAMSPKAFFRPSLYTAHMVASAAAKGAIDTILRRLVDQCCCWRKSNVICVGAADPSAFARDGLAPFSRFVHVPNGIDRAPFVAARRARRMHRRRLRASLGLLEQTPLVACVARLVPQKNVALLADALLPLSNMHAVIIGDGPERAALLRHPLMQQQRLHCLGDRDDVPALLCASDALVLPSLWESQGIVLLEAMAAGLCWVATDTSGARFVQQASGAGRLVPRGDVQALTQAIYETLVARDAEAVRRGDAFVRAHTWPHAAASHARLYRHAWARA